jgi:Flp pilus assembly protein TadD
MAEGGDDGLARLLLELGYFCLQQGRIAEAEALLRGARALRPQEAAPGLCLGMVRFAQGGYAEAERQYREVLAGHPDDDLTRAFLGEAQIAQRRWADARQTLEPVARAGRHPAAAAFAGQLLGQLDRGLFQRSG